MGGGVIQYGTGCVGRRGVHSISKGRGGGEISRPGIVFFTVVVKDLACHTTKNFLELDTRRNERPCPKFEIKKIEKFEKKKKNHVIKIVDRRRVTGERWRLFILLTGSPTHPPTPKKKKRNFSSSTQLKEQTQVSFCILFVYLHTQKERRNVHPLFDGVASLNKKQTMNYLK